MYLVQWPKDNIKINNLIGKYFYSPSLKRSYIENMLLVYIRKCYIMPYMAFLLPMEAEKILKTLFSNPYLLRLLTVEEAYLLTTPTICPSHPI